MNTEMDKKEFTVDASNILQSELRLQSQFSESGGDFVLPDYMPTMQKILRLEAKVLPPSKYVGAANVQMTGDVLHTLIYIGEDGETGATVLPSKYEFSIPIDTFETREVYADVELEGLSYRLTAPRKLNIRTRLNVKPYCYKNEDASASVIPSSAGVNRLYKEISCMKTVVLNSTDTEVSDTVELGNAKNSRLVWCGATAAVNEARAVVGGVSVRGDVLVKILTDEDGEIKSHTKKIPFEEFLDGEVTKEGSAVAVAHVTSVEAVKENETEASAEVVLFIEATVDTPYSLSVMSDAFSSEREIKKETKTVNETKLVAAKNTVHTVNATLLARDAAIPLDADIADTSGRVSVEESVCSNGKIKVLGNCILTSIFSGEGGASSAEYKVPFEINTDCQVPQNAEISCRASLFGCRVRKERDALQCDIDVALCLRALNQNKTEIVSHIDASLGEKYERCKHPLCIIYPCKESLWELAKKYRVNPDDLARVNALDISEKDYTDKNALEKTKVLMLELK